MSRYFFFLLCMTATFTVQAQQTILIDLGSAAKKATGPWNHLTSPTTSGWVLKDARDTDGRATAVRLRQADIWAGYNLTGYVHKNKEFYPSSATSDSYYLERDVDDGARLDIAGLSPEKKYDLRLYGSRYKVQDKRSANVQIGGKKFELVCSNNKTHTIDVQGLAPDAQGVIQISVQLAPESKFAYLGVIEIRGAFGEAEEFREPGDTLDGPPIVTAKSWAVGDAKTGKLLWGQNESASRFCASTTKIMTATLVLDLAKKHPEILEEITTISERAANTGGSSAKLEKGEKIKIRDLLRGLMLPSGNDAAVALAEHCGGHFSETKDLKTGKPGDSLARFVAAMNGRAKSLGMKETHYFDPHGNSRNRSSARNLLLLGWTAMENPAFRELVATRRYSAQLTKPDGSQRTAIWNNTNKLLDIEGYDGVKTGWTSGAGACLVSRGQYQGEQLLVVVMGADSKSGRFIDSRNVYRWAWRKLIRQQEKQAN